MAQELFLRYQIFLKPMISARCFVLHLSDSISWALPQCIGIITITRKYWMKQWLGPLLFQLCSSGAVSYTKGLLCVSLCSRAMDTAGGTAQSFCDVNVPASAGDASGCGWQPLALHSAVSQFSCIPWKKQEPVPAGSAWPDGSLGVHVSSGGEIKSRGSPWPGIFSSHQNPELTWANWSCVATTACRHRIAAVGWLGTLKFSITGAGLGNMPTAIL